MPGDDVALGAKDSFGNTGTQIPADHSVSDVPAQNQRGVYHQFSPETAQLIWLETCKNLTRVRTEAFKIQFPDIVAVVVFIVACETFGELFIPVMNAPPGGYLPKFRLKMKLCRRLEEFSPELIYGKVI